MEATLRRMRDEGAIADYEIIDCADDPGGPEQEVRLAFHAAASAELRERTIESVIVAAMAAGRRVTINAHTSGPHAPAAPGGDAAPAGAADPPREAIPRAWWRRLFPGGAAED